MVRTMTEEKRMNFYRTFYDLTTLLPETERRKVNTALLDYFFEGIEPKGLSASGMKVFRGCEGRISKSRINAANVACRYDDSKATKPPTNTATECVTEQQAEEITKPLPERERERDKEGVTGKRARFRAPTPEEVADYAQGHAAQNGIPLSGFDPERFCDYYASRGWKVGKAPMKDWKATVRNWLRDSKPAQTRSEVGNGDDFSRYD